MGRNWRNKVSLIQRVKIAWDEPLAKHTMFRVGGVVSCIIYPETFEAAIETLKVLNRYRVRYFVLGKGSNLLVADQLPEMAAISLDLGARHFDVWEFGKEARLRVGAGVSISRLIRECMSGGFSGLEFLVGIPGSVGGAVVMNAGTSRGEISRVLKKVTVVSAEGKMELEKEDLDFSYRKSCLPQGSIVWDAVFRVGKDEKKEIKKKVIKILKERKKRQPALLGTAGSVFKNPPGDYAGRLIEEAGLKGKVLGGARISPKHANWIVTSQGARARDVYGLMKLVRERVKDKFGIELEPEVKLIGFD